MKRIIFIAITSIFIYSCSLEVDTVNKPQKAIWNNEEVLLIEGVPANIFEIDEDDLSEIIVPNSRNLDNLSGIGYYEVYETVEYINNTYNLPTFDASTEEEILNNIDILKSYFISYTDEQIAENYDELIDLTYKQFRYLFAINVTNQNSRAIGVNEDEFYVDDKNLTWHEVKACAKYPDSATTLYDVNQRAKRLTKELYGSDKLTNCKSDAFRHVALNILLAKYGKGKKSAKLNWAKTFATAHEKGTNDQGIPSHMDIHNNWYGRDYYNKNTQKKYIKVFGKKICVGVKSEPKESDIRRDIKIMADNATFVPGLDLSNYRKNEASVEAAIDRVTNNVIYLRERTF